MRAQSHTLDWGTQGVSRGRVAQGWFQQLHAWWEARHTMRQQARLRSLYACWDGQHESYSPLRADAARDLVATRSDVSVAVQLYGQV